MSTRSTIAYWPRLGVHIYRELLDHNRIWIELGPESYEITFPVNPWNDRWQL